MSKTASETSRLNTTPPSFAFESMYRVALDTAPLAIADPTLSMVLLPMVLPRDRATVTIYHTSRKKDVCIMDESSISNRRINNFAYRLYKQFRKLERGGLLMIRSFAAPTVAQQYVGMLFSGDPRSSELCDIMMPWVMELVVNEGFPINESLRGRIVENLTHASDRFVGMERGMFSNFTGYESHRILQMIAGSPKRLSRILKRVHPDLQLEFSNMVVRMADVRWRAETQRYSHRRFVDTRWPFLYGRSI